MTCGRCGLSLRQRDAPRIAPLHLDRCPRCFAFAGVSVPLHAGGRLSSLVGEAPKQERPAKALHRPLQFGHLVVCSEQFGDGILISLQGKLDIASEGCFDRALARAWEMGCTRMVIDLSELEFLDAVCLKALLRVREHTLESGHDLLLMRGPPNVQRMFELTGTTDLFTFHD
jgi:anti-anti-sigma factor